MKRVTRPSQGYTCDKLCSFNAGRGNPNQLSSPKTKTSSTPITICFLPKKNKRNQHASMGGAHQSNMVENPGAWQLAVTSWVLKVGEIICRTPEILNTRSPTYRTCSHVHPPDKCEWSICNYLKLSLLVLGRRILIRLQVPMNGHSTDGHQVVEY